MGFNFHFKEHQFSLPEIKSCLKDLKLSFIGFDDFSILGKDNLNNKFNSFFNSGGNILDLDDWHEFENQIWMFLKRCINFGCKKIEQLMNRIYRIFNHIYEFEV